MVIHWEVLLLQVVFDGPLAHENSQWSFAAKAMVQQEGKGIAGRYCILTFALPCTCLFEQMSQGEVNQL